MDSQRTNLKFLIKLRTYLPKSKKLQFFNLFVKFIPLLIISHDLNLYQYKNKISIFTSATFSNFINLNELPDETIQLIICLIFIILLVYVICMWIIYKNSKVINPDANSNFNNYFYGREEVSKCTNYHSLIISTFTIIFIILNQYVYEILFYSFMCNQKGQINSNIDKECFTWMKILTISLSILMIILLIIVNYIYNLIFIQPWFSSDSIYPSKFKEQQYFSIYILLPLLQGYLSLEAGNYIKFSVLFTQIIRYVIRGIFILYMINFYYNSLRFVYSSRKAYMAIIFIKTFCLISIILEFIPQIAAPVTAETFSFIILKFSLQFLCSIIFLHFIIKREENFLQNFNFDKRKCTYKSYTYEALNRIFYAIYNFNNDDNQEILKLILNKIIEYELNKSNANMNVINYSFSENLYDPNTINSNIQSLFKIINSTNKSSYSNIFPVYDENKLKVINSYLKFILKALDNYIYSYFHETANEENEIQIILIYAIYSCFFQKNYNIASYYILKKAKNKLNNQSLQIKLFVEEINYFICIENHERKVKQNLEKVYLKNFFENLHYHILLKKYMRNLIDAVKDLLYKINENMVDYVSFSRVISNVLRLANKFSSNKNPGLLRILNQINTNFESSILINKILVFNKLFFNNCDTYSNLYSINTYEADVNDQFSKIDMFMVLHMNSQDNIIINKICNRMQKSLEIEKIEDYYQLIGKDLRIMIPRNISEFHDQYVMKFMKINRDYIHKDVYFITRNGYALCLNMKSIILPTLNNDIVFFSVFNENENHSKWMNRSNINCFAEISSTGEITVINRDFETKLGISKELIDSKVTKINIFNLILPGVRIDNLFNRSENIQILETTVNLEELLHKIGTINLDNFRDFCLESYIKLTSNLKILQSDNEKMKTSTDLNVRIERRILDNYDPDEFIYTLKIFKEILGNESKLESLDRSTKSSSIERLRSTNFSQSTDNKNLTKVLCELSKISKNMLKEGNRLYEGKVKFSEVAEEDEDDFHNLVKRNGSNSMPISTHSIKLEDQDFSKNKIYKSKFIFFFMICIFFLQELIFYLEISNLKRDYINAYNMYQITHTLLILKFSTLSVSLSLIKSFSIETNKLKLNYEGIKKLKEELIETNIKVIDSSIYNFNLIYSKLDREIQAGLIKKDIEISIKHVNYDYSIYYRNLTIFEYIEKLKSSVYLIDNFQNIYFNLVSNEYYNQNMNKLYDANINSNHMSKGDIAIFFIVNNLIDKLIPNLEELIETNNSNNHIFMKSVSGKKLVNLGINYLFSFFIFIYILLSFYSYKQRIFKKSFEIFNILKLFNNYLIRKIQRLDILINEYSYVNLLIYDRIRFEIPKLISCLKYGNLNVYVKLKKKHLRKINDSMLFEKSNENSEPKQIEVIKKYSSKKNILSTRNLEDLVTNNEANDKPNKFLNISNGIMNIKTSSNIGKNKRTNNSEVNYTTESKVNLINNSKTKDLHINLNDKISMYNLIKKTSSFEETNKNKSANRAINRDFFNINSLKNIQQLQISYSNKSENDKIKNTMPVTDQRLETNIHTTSEGLADNNSKNNDSFINPKNLLNKNRNLISYSISSIFFFVLVVSFGLRTLIDNYISNLENFFDNTKLLTEYSYSHIEMSTILAVTLLKNQNIYSVTKASTTSSILKEKSKYYSNLYMNYKDSLKQIENFSILVDYLNFVDNNEACSHVLSSYYQIKNISSISQPEETSNLQSEIEKCKINSQGIFNKGMILGFFTLLNNFEYENEINFFKYRDNINDLNLVTFFNLEKIIIELNIDNIQNLIEINTVKILDEFHSGLLLIYFLSVILFVFIIFMHSLFFYFMKNRYRLFLEADLILYNMLRI